MEPQQPLICPAHTTQYIGAAIVGILLGAGASFIYLKQAPVSVGGGSYQAGFDAAKKLAEEGPLGMMLRTPDDIRTISGTVTAISGNQITIHTQSANPFDDPTLLDRTITVTATTKITKISPVDPKVFQTEMTDYMKKMQGTKSPSQPLTPPASFTSTPATLASIAVGDTLNVTAIENIKTAKEFSASEIQIETKTAMSASPLLAPVK